MPFSKNVEFLIETYKLCCRTVETQWQYALYQPYNKEILKEPRRVYVQYYYDLNSLKF